MNRLDGKVALISGAARGIGGEAARLMAAAGARVVIGDVLHDRARQTVAAITAAGGDAAFAPLDVTQETAWTAAIGLAVSRYGRLDILVNNAGVFIGKGIEEISLAEWDRLVAVNMTGVFLGTRLAAPALRDAARSSPHGSVIVNLASIAGIVGSQLDPLYSMTKGGVTLFTKSTALEFARKGYRIRANSIHPGVIDTDMGEQTFVSRAQRTGSNDTAPLRQAFAGSVPSGRLGLPIDIANGIVFLASDDSAYMNGAGLVVDGGVTAA
ncbi:MAG: SDR family oxidoreductase [Rhodospirillales bacterium]|jgi:NAD(P)-dependent dehydrogenase (short-subunit alcohol dehydrogenase family)|nr:SDR family oxidoreductase [Rhodospirillales bacterium]